MHTTHMRRKAWMMRVVIAAFVLMISSPSWGQYRKKGLDGDHFHFGYVTGHVGYSMLDTHATGVLPGGNIGGGVGLGYEYRNSGLWANLGVQVSFHRSHMRLDPYSTKDEADQSLYRGIDTQGKSATFHYLVNQTDQIEWNFLDIPVLFGYYTHGFHIGAGLKLSYPIYARTRVTGSYTLSATNDDYGVTFQDMPEQGYKEYEISSMMSDNRLNVNVGLIGEIGYDLLSSMPSHSRTCHVLKLAFYFEYGLNNIAKGNESTIRSVIPNPQNATEATINPYLNTINSPNRTVPFFAGAKITYMIGGSRTARAGFHHGCMCYN